MAEKKLMAEQQEQLQAARTFIQRLEARASQCNQLAGLPILTRGFSAAAKVLEEDLANQLRAHRDGALTENNETQNR